MIHFTKIFYIVFGLFTIAGGLMGYLKAGSLASLIAGGVSGVLLLVAGFIFPASSFNVGLILGLVVSVSLAGYFLPKYFEKRAIFPSGFMALLSIASIVITLLAWYRR